MSEKRARSKRQPIWTTSELRCASRAAAGYHDPRNTRKLPVRINVASETEGQRIARLLRKRYPEVDFLLLVVTADETPATASREAMNA